MILVSIIIPVYKVEPYIVRCVESVLNQTYRRIEVILVDDCTPDRSMDIAKEYIQNSPKSHDLLFKYFKHDHNRGLSAARNTGIDEATGDYVFFLDSDDSISTDCLRCMVDMAKRHSADVVIGEVDVFTGTNRKHVGLDLTDEVVNGNKAILHSYVERRWHVVAWNKLVNTSFLRDNSLYFSEGNIFEDNLWTFQLATCAEILATIHQSTYYYYVRPDAKSILQENSSPSIRWIKYMPILNEMNIYINKRSMANNLDVNFFYMRELNFAVYGLAGCGKLSLGRFSELKKLCCFNLMCLYKNQRITIKELILYYFYHLPPIIDYVYFRSCNIVIGIKERSLEVLLKRKEK